MIIKFFITCTIIFVNVTTNNCMRLAQQSPIGEAIGRGDYDTVVQLITTGKASVNDSALVPDGDFKAVSLLCFALHNYRFSYNTIMDLDSLKPQNQIKAKERFEKDQKIVCFLLEKKAPVNDVDPETGHSPLHIALKYNLPNHLITLLLQYGANPLQTNSQGLSAQNIMLNKKQNPDLTQFFKNMKL